MHVRRAGVAFGAALLLAAGIANAEDDTGGGAEAPPAANPDTPPEEVASPSASQPSTTTTTQSFSPYGVPAPGTDLEEGLPSSSKALTNVNESKSGFDLYNSASGGEVVGGGADAPAYEKKQSGSPVFHVVKHKDTLWDLSARYFNNPWSWPKLWAQNPQIQNPHWIYAGDQIRLRDETPGAASRETISLGSGLINRRPLVPKNTIFVRNLGYIDDPEKDVWGQMVGARREKALLVDADEAYVILRPGADARIGQLLSVFRPINPAPSVKGGRDAPGDVIALKGTVKIDSYDPKTRIARTHIVESLDAIERGDSVGPVGRRFDVVPPRPSEVDLWARVLRSIYPHEVMGQNQIVFVDKGRRDGLKPGNRLFIVDRGDTWRRTLETTTEMARSSVVMESDSSVDTYTMPLTGSNDDFPEEVVGELRILRVRDYSSVAIVVEAIREIEKGERLVSRKGY